MKFIIDHDYHIHTNLSPCANDPLQTPENILRHAEEHGLKHICLADHFWDALVPTTCGRLSGTYRDNDYARNSSVLPLPQGKNTVFHYGCEGEMDLGFVIGIAPETVKKHEFIVISTTHLHIGMVAEQNLTLEQRAVLYVQRLHTLLDSDLPDGKVGFAHPTTCLIAMPDRGAYLKVLDMIPDGVFRALFQKLESRRFGVELNFDSDLREFSDPDLDRVLRPYRIAKECGCKFYLGSDAHTAKELAASLGKFESYVDALNLTEDDKFRPFETL